jgi:hypothetical protein
MNRFVSCSAVAIALLGFGVVQSSASVIEVVDVGAGGVDGNYNFYYTSSASGSVEFVIKDTTSSVWDVTMALTTPSSQYKVVPVTKWDATLSPGATYSPTGNSAFNYLISGNSTGQLGTGPVFPTLIIDPGQTVDLFVQTVAGYTPNKNQGFNADITVDPTPLPATFALFAGGLGVIGLFSRRKSRRVANVAAA